MRRTRRILTLSSGDKPALLSSGGQIEELKTTPRTNCAVAFLLIDCSGSMAGEKLADAKQGATEFARDAQLRGYLVGLIAFGNDAELVCEPAASLEWLGDRIASISAGGSTNLAAALQLASRHLPHAGCRAMVVVTDGVPDDPCAALGAAEEAKRDGVDIVTIGTDDADREFLRKLASVSSLSQTVERAKLGSTLAVVARLLPAPRF